MLHDAWMLKRRLTSRITTPAIDETLHRSQISWGLGGKLLGAGGGGSCCSLQNLSITNGSGSALPGLLQVPFKFEGLGSQIVFYQEDHLMLDDVWAQSSAQTASQLKAALIGKAA